MRTDKLLYVVVPCYQEEAVLPETAKRLKRELARLLEAGKIAPESRILFVNDGSKDRTWRIIEELYAADPIYAGVNLSRNRGHQFALLAGLETAAQHADMIVSMDADLQDDIGAMEKMIDAYHEGYDVVYGVRSERKTDTWFKRTTAQGFYKLMSLLGAEVIYNHADYRLMSRRAVEGLMEFSEVNLFLRGIVPQVGYRWTTVEYARAERFAGESKYPLKKMLSFALNGVTSFSVRPMRLILLLGGVVFLISIIMMLWTLVCRIAGNTVGGWSSLMCSIWMLGGIQLFSMGVIGEYIGKIYSETKRRPRYIIERVLLKEDKGE